MIASLTGRLGSIGADFAVVDVGGVGYRVFCSARTLGALPPPGETVTLLTETHVREDHIHLFGFSEEAERAWFGLLQKVQGVGARMALAVLAVLPPRELALAIAAGDKAALQQVGGVGAKLGLRIVTELKDKAPVLPGPAGAVAGLGAGGAGGGLLSDAVSALTNLGYRPSEATAAVAVNVRDLGPDAELGEVVRGALRELTK